MRKSIQNLIIACICSATILIGCNRSRKSDPSKPGVTIQDKFATISGKRFNTPDERIGVDEEWPSELFAEQVSNVLDRIQNACNRKIEIDKVRDVFFDADFRLDFANLNDISESESTTVWRQDSTRRKLSGAKGVDQFIAALSSASESGNSTIRKIKIIGVEFEGKGEPTTELRIESVSLADRRRYQMTQNWHCTWKTIENEAPKLSSSTLIFVERVRDDGELQFSDGTFDVLGSLPAFREQLQFGLQQWLERIETCHGMNYFSKHGLAVADVNGDGMDDVYVCQPAGLPNRLFLQKMDGTAADASQEFGVDILDRTTSAIFADLDNDGDQDLAAASLEGVLIMENVDNRRFIERARLRLPDRDLQGITAVDFDRDGDLDLYQIVDYATGNSRAQLGLPSFVYHNANDGGSNHLFRNDIDTANRQWAFTDITREVGLHVNNQRHSLAAAWEDYDDDGDQDLYVANDYGQNCLYRNDDGSFTDVATEAGVSDFGSGMSVAWGDYDRNGAMDLYVSNMFSSAGSRLTTQREFLPQVADSRRALYQRFAKGNSLFRNAGSGKFIETGKQVNVEIARWAWSSQFADVDNDGWQDLLVANGYITTDDTGDL